MEIRSCGGNIIVGVKLFTYQSAIQITKNNECFDIWSERIGL